MPTASTAIAKAIKAYLTGGRSHSCSARSIGADCSQTLRRGDPRAVEPRRPQPVQRQAVHARRDQELRRAEGQRYQAAAAQQLLVGTQELGVARSACGVSG